MFQRQTKTSVENNKQTRSGVLETAIIIIIIIIIVIIIIMFGLLLARIVCNCLLNPFHPDCKTVFCVHFQAYFSIFIKNNQGNTSEFKMYID